MAFFAAFLLAAGSAKAPAGPAGFPPATTAPGARYFPGPVSSGAAFARLKFPDPLVVDAQVGFRKQKLKAVIISHFGFKGLVSGGFNLCFHRVTVVVMNAICVATIDTNC